MRNSIPKQFVGETRQNQKKGFSPKIKKLDGIFIQEHFSMALPS